jgi:hypothetical protein
MIYDESEGGLYGNARLAQKTPIRKPAPRRKPEA